MSWNTRNNCFWIIIENPCKILWGCSTCVGRVKTVVTNSRTTCSDFSLVAMAGSEIPDYDADSVLTNLQLGNGSVYGQILNRSWKILPVERNLKEPLWFTQCCLTRDSLYPHIAETKTMFSNGINTQALRYDNNSSHVRS